MTNPYLITGPAQLHISGGRTSGFMLHQILQAHGGTLPSDVVVGFANTGKERPETLRFVREMSDRWGVHIRWVEWRPKGSDAFPYDDPDSPAARWTLDAADRCGQAGFEEVDFSSASRDGEPFAALIAKKRRLPNWQERWCTGELKVKTMMAFMASLGHAPNSYTEALGLRHDEGARLLKMYAGNETHGRKCVAPLSKAKVKKADVMAFWAKQDFDLQLAAHEGNCDLCFLKGRRLRMRLIRDNPGMHLWWAAQEISENGTFDRRDSVLDLVEEARRSPDFFDADDREYDTECGLTCAGDAA